MIEVSRFWRDPALPFVEARRVGDGRQVCYAAHSHESFSIGVITGGRSTYLTGGTQREVGAGATVVMNPGVVHACNPIEGWGRRLGWVLKKSSPLHERRRQGPAAFAYFCPRGRR